MFLVPGMNVFRILADISHTTSKAILLHSIHSNKSAEGVSLLTQVLYLLVFSTRYLDIFTTAPKASYWNFILKIFYIASSAYIVWLMMRVYARTREREYAWKLAMWTLGGSVVGAVAVWVGEVGLYVVHGGRRVPFWGSLGEICWIFSQILEAFCVLPQLLLLRQTSVPTVLDSFYLVTLGSYRGFYILNWIYKAAKHQPNNKVSIVFGVIQTLFYIDFAWVYWTRQRVKLRGGGVVDGEDLSKSYLVRRFIGRRAADQEQEDVVAEDEALVGQESGIVRPPGGGGGAGGRWGARGISVSADDTLAEHHGEADRDAQMVDPAHFEDEDEEDPFSKPAESNRGREQERADDARPGSAGNIVGSSAEEWQENTGTFGK